MAQSTRMGKVSPSVGVYARALSSVIAAQSARQAEATLEALRALGVSVGKGQLRHWLESPGISRRDRADQLIALLGEGLPEAVHHLLRLLAEHGRLSSLAQLAPACEAELRRQRGQLTATAVCASPPAPAERQLLRQQLEKRFLPRSSAASPESKSEPQASLELEFQTDASLLAGFVARCADTVIDASLAGRLERLRQHITA